MATIVRVKRRRDEDPLEILLLANKKAKNEVSNDASILDKSEKTSFKFAGTVSSKVDGISRHVREAIRKEKLEREYKQHQANILGSVRQQSRQHKHQKSQQNRFRVISKHRALELDCLDASKVDNKDRKQTVCQKCGLEIKSRCVPNIKKSVKDQPLVDISETIHSNVRKDTKESINTTSLGPDLECSCDKENKNENPSEQKETVGNSQKQCVPKDTSCAHSREETKSGDGDTNSSKVGGDAAAAGGNGLFCLVDMESESAANMKATGSSLADQITCNSEPMEREVVSEHPNDDDYVYDIYYTNSQQFDFRMFERDLTFEAYNGGLMFDREFDDEDDALVYEDDEDEDAENNWRNDYPDEDPRYFENESSNYNFTEDMNEYVAFETETGNQLADWMSWRCNIDGTELSSDDDDVDHYGDSKTTYDSYYTQIRKEMGEEQEDSD